MDGRSIRNAVLSAQRIAISEKVPLSLDHIHTVIKYSESFLRDFKELDDEVGPFAPCAGRG